MNTEMTVETILKDKDGKVIAKKESAIVRIDVFSPVEFGPLKTEITTSVVNKYQDDVMFSHEDIFDIFANDNRNYKLYLDDIREPKNDNFVIARDFKSFKTIVERFGIPNYISFDHDLGTEETGYDCVKWMCNYMLDNKLKFPADFDYNIHSANPIGAINIRMYLKNFIKILKSA